MKESSLAVLRNRKPKQESKQFVPIGDWVLIRRIEQEGEGVIKLPDNAKERSDTGIIVAAGSGTSEFSAGDEVMFTKYGMDVKVNGEKLVLVKAAEVYMKFSNDSNN